MEHFTLGRNNGLRVSALALGAGMFGTRWGYGAEPDVANAIFDRFADAGGTTIDTAASYQVGESEETLGRLLSGRRDQFSVATKFAIGGADGTGPLQTGNSRRAMVRSVEASLRRLQTDYIDLLWVHFPDFVTPGRRDHACLRRSGVRRKGALRRTVELPGLADRACDARWPRCAVGRRWRRCSSNTASSSAAATGRTCRWPRRWGWVRRCGRRWAAGCCRASTAPASRVGSPTGSGRLIHTEDDDRKAATVDAVLAVAEDLGVPPAQVAVAWLAERARRSSTGVVPIIGPRTVEQLDSYLAALDVRLGDWYARLDEVSRIDLGQPHTSNAEQSPVVLGGVGSGIPPALIRILDTQSRFQACALGAEEVLGHAGFRRNLVEAVERAGDDVDLAGHPGVSQPLRVGEVFVVEQVEGADADPCRWEAGQIGSSRRHRLIAIGVAEVALPGEFVAACTPGAESRRSGPSVRSSSIG